MMDVNGFLSQVSTAGGLAKQNRYDVLIPAVLLGTNSSAIFNAIEAQNPNVTVDWMADWYNVDMGATAIELTAFCEKSELPSYQFQLETVRHYGPSFKIPHMPEYQDTTMTFLCGASMWERYFFDAWMYMVMDPYTNDFNYKNEYSVGIDVIQYYDQATSVDSNGQYTIDPNYSTTLVDAFPIAVNAQELGYDNNNSVQKVQVTFSYKYATPYGKKSTTGAPQRGKPQPFAQSIKLNPASGGAISTATGTIRG